jgi:hypothetical protein
MEADRELKLETLKARIGRSDYEVDTTAVADAIVRRLLDARGRLAASVDGLEPPPSPAPSGDVLEAG